MQSIADALGRSLESFEVRGSFGEFSLADAHCAISAIIAPDTPEPTRRFSGEMLRMAVCGRQGREVLNCIRAALLEPGHREAAYELLLQCLSFAASWANRLFDLETALAVLAAPHMTQWRQSFVRSMLEPLLYASDGQLRPEQLGRVSSLLREPDDMRLLVQPLGRAFSGKLQTEVDRILGYGVRRVLVVQNIRDGQGDEIIRCVPLIQAFLDFNPELAIVLLTKRGYLYAHPRVKVVPLDDSLAVAEELTTEFDGVLDFFETNVRTMNHEDALEAKIWSYVQNRRPALFLTSGKAYNHFVYKRVEIEGRCYARSLGLDRQRVRNVYDTTFRLLTEMGLPVRVGQNTPVSEWVLAGCHWSAAAMDWERVTESNVDKRPVALLGPFGGAEPLKGFTECDEESLAARISNLVAERFFVVLAPNGTAWGSAARARSVIAHLAPEEQRFVAIAPDSIGTTGQPERFRVGSEFTARDIATRMLIYFIRFASLVVAVEGWMIHAAYCMGKPYRTLMMAYSQGTDWQPFAQTSQQQIECPMQPLKLRRGSPLVVEQPRKFFLIALLRLCGASSDPRATDLLYEATRSPDHDLRAAAVAGLSERLDDTAQNLTVAALQDPWYRVRAVAAEALLLRNSDVARETLLVHVLIGKAKREWAAIMPLGTDAIPALEIAACDQDEVIRREAIWAIASLKTGPEFHRPRARPRSIRMLSQLMRAAAARRPKA